MIRLAVAGAGGRMGRMIIALAQAQPRVFRLTGAIEQPQSSVLGQDAGVLAGGAACGAAVTSDTAQALEKADVLIDFTHCSVTAGMLKAAVKSKTAYVLGTTNLSASVLKSIRTASRRIAIVQAPNMSIGVNLLFRLVEMTSRILDETYDIEIVEAHHRHKKDSPSGTAMKLLEIAAGARKRTVRKDAVFGREGDIGARPSGQIGVLAVRGGDVVGDHTVSYLGDGERVELIHKASSREAFAKGALTAAKFVAKRKTGLYDMMQVLGM